MQYLAKGKVRITGAFLYQAISEHNIKLASKIGQEWAHENDLVYCGLATLIGFRITRQYPDSPAIHTVDSISVGSLRQSDITNKLEAASAVFLSAEDWTPNCVIVMYALYDTGASNYKHEIKRYQP